MSKKKIDTLTQQEEVTLHRLEKFAQLHNLELFNVRGSLYQRVETITRNNGRCPCYRERPHCPCKECLQEVKENGECGCRVFLTPRCKG